MHCAKCQNDSTPKKVSWTNANSRDLCFTWVSEDILYCHSPYNLTQKSTHHGRIKGRMGLLTSTNCSLGDVILILKVLSPNTCCRLSSLALLVKLHSCEYHRTSSMMNWYRCRYKTLSQPMSTKTYYAKCHHETTISQDNWQCYNGTALCNQGKPSRMQCPFSSQIALSAHIKLPRRNRKESTKWKLSLRYQLPCWLNGSYIEFIFVYSIILFHSMVGDAVPILKIIMHKHVLSKRSQIQLQNDKRYIYITQKKFIPVYGIAEWFERCSLEFRYNQINSHRFLQDAYIEETNVYNYLPTLTFMPLFKFNDFQ